MLLRTAVNCANMKSPKFSVTIIMHFIFNHVTDILVTCFLEINSEDWGAEERVYCEFTTVNVLVSLLILIFLENRTKSLLHKKKETVWKQTVNTVCVHLWIKSDEKDESSCLTLMRVI